MSTGGSKRAVFVALLANLGIAVAKFVGFAFTRSSSMLAEGVHSLADTGNQLLLLLGDRRSQLAPTEAHPFGYGRERYFWGFVVSIVLFALGLDVRGRSRASRRSSTPTRSSRPGGRMAILAGRRGARGLVVPHRHPRVQPAARRARRGAQFIRQAKAPELPVLLLEDSGALVGLLIAFVCLLAGHRHRQLGVGRRSARCSSACCSAPSPSSWPPR